MPDTDYGVLAVMHRHVAAIYDERAEALEVTETRNAAHRIQFFSPFECVSPADRRR